MEEDSDIRVLLAGLIAAGVVVAQATRPVPVGTTDDEAIADRAVRLADLVIARLEKK